MGASAILPETHLPIKCRGQGFNRHADVARDAAQLLEGVERKAKELLDEQSNVSSDRNRVVVPPLPVELSTSNGVDTLPS